MAADDWCWRWGVEDATFGLNPFHPSAPITPDTRERYMKGFNSQEAKIAANRAMVQREKDRKAKAAARWKTQLNGEEPKVRKPRGKHEHGKDW